MPIKITYYCQPLTPFRQESSEKGAIIFSVLVNSPEWSDDMWFEDDNGNVYCIDDLIGKEVSVPDIGVFTVPNEE
jgi:hypothetical protein